MTIKSILLSTRQCDRITFATWLGHSAIYLMLLGLPFSTAAVSVGMILTLFAFILRGNSREDWQQMRSQPFVKGLGLLLGVVSVGVLYSSASWSLIGENYQDLSKLALFLCCLPFIQSAATKKKLLMIFTIAVSVLVVLSDLKYFGVIDLGRQYARSAVFKDYQINALLYSTLVFLYCVLAKAYPDYKKRCLAIAAVFTIQTIFINEGRIGYGYISLLILYYGWVVDHWRGLLKSIVLLVGMFALAYQCSPNFNSRMSLLFTELKAYQQVSQDSPASLHLRLNFARNTLSLIEKKPWLGYGTGSFSPVYQQHSEQLGWVTTSNPHNYYLFITMQYGLLGLGVFLSFLVYLWYHTSQLPQLERTLGRGVLLIYGFGCGYNSMLMDYTETIFFALMMSVVYAVYQQPVRTTTLSTLRHITVH